MTNVSWGTLSVVQSTGIYNSSGGGSISVSFNVNPTTGNLLVAGSAGIDTPAGWTILDSSSSAYGTLQTLYHVVGSGEANSYTFTNTGGVGINEVTGQASSLFIDSHTIKNDMTGPGNVTAVATPAVIGDLALSFFTPYIMEAPVTVSSGWTIAVSTPLSVSFSGMVAASRNSLTSDTSTPISNTFTPVNPDAQQLTAAMVLVKPAAPAAVVPRSAASFSGGKISISGVRLSIQ